MTTTRHYAEVFITDAFLGERWYGWQCFECREEVTGLNSMQEAREGADRHQFGDVR